MGKQRAIERTVAEFRQQQEVVDLCYEVVIFFFQAEDGIRDYKVTGVQTCALPISPSSRIPLRSWVVQLSKKSDPMPPSIWLCKVAVNEKVRSSFRGFATGGARGVRSEERRVGKEGRSRGAPYH